MISVAHRFHGYGSLRGVYQGGQTVRGSLLSLRFRNRGANKPYRVAVVVSRKVSKSAVVRNRIRRRIYEIIRQSESIIAPGTDLVITAFDDKLATIEAAKLQSATQELLNKAAGQVTK
ncbi:MAG: ribonuclease P protein component [Patescibacteria group bacterium]